MSIGGRTWPSTETSGDRRYAKDSPDRPGADPRSYKTDDDNVCRSASGHWKQGTRDRHAMF